MKRILTAILSIVMLMSLLASCAADGNEPEAPSGNQQENSSDAQQENTQDNNTSGDQEKREDFVFTDDCGREVEVDGEITRIASTGPISVIAMFGIAPEKLVGMPTEWDNNAKKIIPEQYWDMPVIGSVYGGKGQVNPEELVLLDPQLVIDVGQAKETIVEDLDALQEQTGVKFVHIEAHLQTMPDAYRRLGELLGKEEEAEEMASYLEEIWARTESLMEKVGDNRAKIVCCLGTDGLNVLAKSTYHSEIIDMLTDNLAVVQDSSAKGTGDPVDMEQLLIWDPDYIIFYPDVDRATADSAEWQKLSAIENGNYVYVPDVPYNWLGNPPSAQRYLGLIWLPAVLYPEYVEYDVFEECAKYYELFYHVELTREVFDEITAGSFIER